MEVLNEAYVSSPYGNRKVNGKISFHSGVDLLSASGNRVVFANNDGKVISVVNRMKDTDKVNEGEYSKYAGNYVILEHGDGYTSQYSHLKYDSFKVKEGDIVKEGQALAEEGSSGYAFGVHLDYMVKLNGKTVDPTDFGLGKALIPAYKEETSTVLPTTYIVKSGDTLSGIAKAFYGNGDTAHYMCIANANNIVDVNLIHVGQVLTIPVYTDASSIEINVGDSVLVNGIGSASSDGSGPVTRNFSNKKMKVISINKGAKNEYALNQYNENSGITAWFNINDIVKV